MAKIRKGERPVSGEIVDFKTAYRGMNASMDEIKEMLGFVVENMATKDDIAEVREEMADVKKELKGDIAELRTDLLAVHVQVNGIESELRQARQERLSVRVGDLEEKVFGKARS